jgi:hypothetical protein
MKSALRRILRHAAGYASVLALVALIYVTDLDGRLFIRNAIPLFFVIGMGFGAFPRSVAICRQSLLPLSLMAALLLGSWVKDDVEWSSTSFLGLATFSAVVVGLAAYLPLTPRVATWGRRYAFVIFLCHAWVILGFQQLWGRYEWSEMSYIIAAGLGSIVLGLALARRSPISNRCFQV